MKAIKTFVKKFDLFGVPFSLRYRDEEKFTTSLGGLFSILFFIFLMFYEIYYFIPFFNRENFSIIYFAHQLAKTETFKLEESKANFAFGLVCSVDQMDGTKAEDLFEIDAKICSFIPSGENRQKIKKYISIHPCNYSDFYNNYNEKFDILGLSNTFCLDQKDHAIEGIYTDEVFTYYEISVVIKEDKPENYDKATKYLTRNDCNLDFFYTHITFDLNNYKEPIKPNMHDIYVQLNPISVVKKNIYFMNQYFDDDHNLFFLYDAKEPMKELLYSRTEEFILYKGLDRGIQKPVDYEVYARFYIRADTQKIEIKRKYQKVMEFIADTSSLIEAIFSIMVIIFSYFNGFYSFHSLGKKVFFSKK